MKCARCQAKTAGTTVTVQDKHCTSTWKFCAFHAERITYILRVYVEAPAHKARPNP